MYEQYTDKQIVEMLKPKLAKLGWGKDVDSIYHFPETCKMIATIYRSAYIRGQLGRSFIIGGKKADEKKVKKSVNTFKVGNKVKFLGLGVEDEEALNNRRFYPPVNTVGKIVKLDSDYCFVRWPKGIVSGDEVGAYRNIYLEKVIEHWVPATRDNVKVGNKVRMIDETGHRNTPEWLPDVGTVGTVTEVGFPTCLIQWPEGSTSGKDKWYCNGICLEVLVCE
jgi:hypothetical protein